MEQFHPEDVEKNKDPIKSEAELAEVKVRSLERAQRIQEVKALNQPVEESPAKNADVPSHNENKNGREVTIVGNPVGDGAFNHHQGKNDLGYQGDCGLVSCQDVLNQHGQEVTENDIVQHADQNNLCDNTQSKAKDCGGTTPEQQSRILKDHGVPAHVEKGGSLESLAQNIGQGRSVIVEVNSDTLWKVNNPYDTGQADHAVVVTGVEMDQQTQKISGFYINDSGDGISNKFIDAKTMQEAWADAQGRYGHGQCVVTDVSRSWKSK
jgi:hypothetical protein